MNAAIGVLEMTAAAPGTVARFEKTEGADYLTPVYLFVLYGSDGWREGPYELVPYISVDGRGLVPASDIAGYRGLSQDNRCCHCREDREQ